MSNTFVIALRATLVTLVVTGIAYPLAVTGIAQVVFPYRANGSVVTDQQGRDVGSELIGQGFADPAYLQGRPSANGYDGSNSGGTNLAVTSKKLRDGQPDDPATKDVDESFAGATQLASDYRAANKLAGEDVPADAVTRSASGLDPDISPDNARLQARRIADARGIKSVDRVASIIEEHVAGRDFGVFGEPHVNVLAVNLALDRTFGAPPKPAKTAGP
jgi:K+-transporting ATPase ATPase C chain